MAGNLVKWWRHKILGTYKNFSGKKYFNDYVSSLLTILRTTLKMLEQEAHDEIYLLINGS